jgi:alpha-mannosidase
VASGYLRAARQLQLAALRLPPSTPSLQQLTQTVALLQHHDAITGTDRFVVNQDYRRLLAAGVSSAAQPVVAGSSCWSTPVPVCCGGRYAQTQHVSYYRH